MSNPVNPLDRYRSYSYQHFLLVANNTEALRGLQTNQLSLAALSKLSHNQSIDVNGSKVVMVMNSEIDSIFYIDSLSYTSSYVGMKAGKHLSLTTDIVMVVRDTYGIAFLNFIRDLVDNTMSTSANGLVFMLKTFFIGHTDQGTTEAIPSGGLDPIPLIFFDVESSFDASGGVHTIKAAGSGAGAPLADPSLLFVNRNLNLATNNNSTLIKDLVQDLQDKMNDQLKAQFQAVKQATGGNGRQVKYMITIPDDWASYTVSSITKDNFVEKVFQKEQQANEQTQQSVPNSAPKSTSDEDRFKTSVNTNVKVTVPQLLSEIFKHCDQIHLDLIGSDDLATKTNTGDVPKMYQIKSAITSDSSSVTVHFDVLNFYLPRVTDDKDSNNQQTVVNRTKQEQQANNDRHAQEAKYGIVYDYIFTGKNTDILNFDIKANLIGLFMQGNRPGANEALSSDNVRSASADPSQSKQTDKKTVPAIEIRKYDPVYLPQLTSEGQRGYVYASPDSAKYRDAWVRYVARMVASNSGGHVEIRGNPAFLNQQIPELYPHDDTAYKQKLTQDAAAAKAAAKTMTGQFDTTKQTSYAGDKSEYIPLLVKINIYTPDPDNKGKYIPYFYQGYYSVIQAENKFVNGEFIQTLQLNAYDLNDLDDVSPTVGTGGQK